MFPWFFFFFNNLVAMETVSFVWCIHRGTGGRLQPRECEFLKSRLFFLKKNKQCLENRNTKVFDRRWKNTVKLLWRCPCLGREAAKPVTTVDYEVFVEYGSWRRQVHERFEIFSSPTLHGFLLGKKPGAQGLSCSLQDIGDVGAHVEGSCRTGAMLYASLHLPGWEWGD